MKNDFFGFYPPEKDEIDKMWKTSIIALDANVLLNLYRYTKSTKDDFLDVLGQYSDRLWLPYQAGYEFHNNRIKVIKDQERSYEDIGKGLDSFMESISEKLNLYKRHPFIKPDNIANQIEANFNKIKRDLDKLSQKHPEYLKNDDILPVVTNLFNGKVGRTFSESELNEIFKEGEKRFDKNIPPGYKDKVNKRKSGERHLYGDLIIWKELIHQSKSTNKTIIFITDDRKDDWWLKYNGETIRPREELIKEFFDETSYRILIYQADVFLKYANERIQKSIKEKSIEEMKEVRLEDESNYYSLVRKLSHLDGQNRYMGGAEIPSFDWNQSSISAFEVSEAISRINDSLSGFNQINNSPWDQIKGINDIIKGNEEIYQAINKASLLNSSKDHREYLHSNNKNNTDDNISEK